MPPAKAGNQYFAAVKNIDPPERLAIQRLGQARHGSKWPSDALINALTTLSRRTVNLNHANTPLGTLAVSNDVAESN